MNPRTAAATHSTAYTHLATDSAVEEIQTASLSGIQRQVKDLLCTKEICGGLLTTRGLVEHPAAK
jgi:hypothetical protein